MPEQFGAYMFELLFAPLRKVRKTANQFYLFFQVAGRHLDACKAALFRLREESAVLAASDAMLPVHGQDRGMPRLKGETLEGYRTRLALKGAIAEKAGTNEGIRYLARAFGYDQVELLPAEDPAHWAEATVQFIGGRIVLDDRALLLNELNKIKPARTLLNLSKEQRYRAAVRLGTACLIGREMTIRQV